MIDWENEWESAHQRSPLKITAQNEARWRNFWNLDASYYLKEVKWESVIYERAVDRLMKEGWIGSNDTVIDIGSGPGTFALPLAPYVRSVTALDEARGMLDQLNMECAKRKICNIMTIDANWDTFEKTPKYDLVMSALSPAVRTKEDLFEMEKISKERCCLISPCPSNWMTARNDLWTSLVGEFVPSDPYSVKYPLNILMENRRDLELFRVAAETETMFPSDEVVEHYTNYFSIFTQMTAEKIGIVKQYVESRSDDGVMRLKRFKCLNILCWKIPDRS